MDVWWAGLGFLLAGPAVAAPAPDLDLSDLTSMSLAELLDLEIGVATKTSLSARETPGVVTVILREQLLASGARDLIDVLRAVPGLDFGVDVQGVVGLGVRGEWAHEGKALLLIDGHVMNEISFTTLQFGNHYPVSMIDRIEIIRGPGSAVYGGYAELAVISVTTLAASETTGLDVVGSGSMVGERALGRANLGASWSGELGDDGRVGLMLYGGEGRRGADRYTDLFGEGYDMAPSSRLAPLEGSFSVRKGALQVQALVDIFRTEHRDGFDAIDGKDIQNDFRGGWLAASWKAKVSESLALTPSLTGTVQQPWWSSRDITPSNYNFEQTTAERGTAGLDAHWTPSDAVDMTFGAQGSADHAQKSDATPRRSWYGGEDQSVLFGNGAVYAQGLFTKPKLATLTVGVRGELHSVYGPSVVPRGGITRAWKRAHLKLLAARAFRAPGIAQIDGGADTPESTTMLEAELGGGSVDHLYVTANVYDLGIRNPIVYFYEYDEVTDAEAEGYRNYARTGTRGGEIEARAAVDGLTATVSWSTYVVAPERAEIPPYRVPDAPSAHLGLANHKGVLRLTATPVDQLSITPTVVWLSPRWGQVGATPDDDPVIGALPSAVLLDLWVRVRDVGVKGLDLGVGGFDLLDQNPPFVQPYNALHASLPGAGRELALSVAYRM